MRELLQGLDQNRPVDGWLVEPITGGANNRLYRVCDQNGEYVVKFTINDPRRRAEREFNALKILADAGLDLAPKPVLLDMETYSLPVIVQTWVDGETGAPHSDDQWEMLAHYFAALHSVPSEAVTTFPKPVVYMESPAQCREVVLEKLHRVPPEAQPDSLRDLVARFDALSMPEWEPPRLTLIRTDSNPRNFIWNGALKSVDWEYSGASDPAFDIADMIVHAAYLDVPRERWEVLIDRYCTLVDDRDCERRIRAYWRAMAVWWAGRFVQYLYEIPRGLDQRLVEPAPDWKEQGERKYAHYLELADALF